MKDCYILKYNMNTEKWPNNNLMKGTEVNRRPVCVKCSKVTGRVVRLSTKCNGVYIPYGHESALAGDLWVCPVCGAEIVEGFGDCLEKLVAAQALVSDYAILRGVRD
jgi:hypothetical protein